MILTILLVLLICSLLFGGWGATRPDWGYWGWSPLGFILVLLLVLWLLGVVH